MQISLGRYQTRSNRVVDITGSRIVPRHEPGNPSPVPTKMWVGTLYQMDGRTPESEYTWTDAGGFYGTAQGVASPQDLVNRISPEAPPEPEIQQEVPATRLQVEALTEATAKVEELRETLGLIRFRAVEALSAPDGDLFGQCLQQIVGLVNEAIEAKVPA